jgi:hypothetical protein
MRNYALLLAGVCLLSSPVGAAAIDVSAQAAQTAKPAPPAAKPSAERKEVKVTEKVLKTYVGEYELQPGRTLTITFDKGYLWGRPSTSQNPPRQLFAESQTKFFLKDLNVQLTFHKDAKGVVTGMLYSQDGKEVETKKVK